MALAASGAQAVSVINWVTARNRMGKTFDIGIESLAGKKGALLREPRTAPLPLPLRGAAKAAPTVAAGAAAGKSFFIETFGCQMNDHDSEKVAGVLQGRGYWPVETPSQADLVLYNTCSIREKAAQKVFARLGDWKTLARRENYRRAGMPGAAGRRRNFRARAVGEPGVRFGELSQAAAVDRSAGIGRAARYGPGPGHRRNFRDGNHAARQSAARVHHDHRRLRLLVLVLRGAAHARAGTQPASEAVLAEARSGWPMRATRKFSCWGRP